MYTKVDSFLYKKLSRLVAHSILFLEYYQVNIKLDMKSM